MDRKSARQLFESAAGSRHHRDGREMVIAVPGTIDAHVDRMHDRWSGHHAPTVELLPMHVTQREIVSRTDGRSPLLGLGEREFSADDNRFHRAIRTC